MTWTYGLALSLFVTTVAATAPAMAGGSRPSTEVNIFLVGDDHRVAVSDADKRAKEIECSKQADAKDLHGAARLKFRAACKSAKAKSET